MPASPHDGPPSQRAGADGPVASHDIAAAAERLAPHLPATPLLSLDGIRPGLLVKAEHLQRTGSFKIRGALNAVLAMRTDRVVTASSGNHGLAVATAAAVVGATARVHLPRGASPAKAAAIRRAGGEIVTADSTDALAAEEAARDESRRSGVPYISPYNDRLVIAGQGTVAVEVVEQLRRGGHPPPATVVVSVGGGGLITGIATWLAAELPHTAVVGAQPAADPAMLACLDAGEVVRIDAAPTFSDGTAGNLEAGAITLTACARLVHRWVRVEEADIARGVAAMIDHAHHLVEGSAGLAIAAATREAPGPVVAVSCGANVSSRRLAEILAAAS